MIHLRSCLRAGVVGVVGMLWISGACTEFSNTESPGDDAGGGLPEGATADGPPGQATEAGPADASSCLAAAFADDFEREEVALPGWAFSGNSLRARLTISTAQWQSGARSLGVEVTPLVDGGSNSAAALTRPLAGSCVAVVLAIRPGGPGTGTTDVLRVQATPADGKSPPILLFGSMVSATDFRLSEQRYGNNGTFKNLAVVALPDGVWTTLTVLYAAPRAITLLVDGAPRTLLTDPVHDVTGVAEVAIGAVSANPEASRTIFIDDFSVK